MINFLKKIIPAIEFYFASLRNPTIRHSWTHEGLKKSYETAYRKFQKMHSHRLTKRDEIAYNSDYNISADDGYKVIDLKQNDIFSKAIKHCENNFSINFIRQNRTAGPKQDTLLTVSIDLNDDKNKIIRQLAMLPDLIGPISHYLGSIPFIIGSYVWFSPNDRNVPPSGSQLFHFDREDVKQIKCFIPIEEIDDECGPLGLIPASYSHQFMQHRKDHNQDITLSQRYTDNEIFDVIGEDKTLKMTGKVGDAILADTSNCLHYGSRRAVKPKYHITLHYVSAFSKKIFEQNLNVPQSNLNKNMSVEEMLFKLR